MRCDFCATERGSFLPTCVGGVLVSRVKYFLRPHSERFCDVAITVNFNCDCNVAKSLRMGPLIQKVCMYWKVNTLLSGSLWWLLCLCHLRVTLPPHLLTSRLPIQTNKHKPLTRHASSTDRSQRAPFLRLRSLIRSWKLNNDAPLMRYVSSSFDQVTFRETT